MKEPPFEACSDGGSFRLRIAIFSDSVLPVANGVSISVDRLIQGLRRAGHDPVLFGPGSHLPMLGSGRPGGYPLVVPPFGSARRRFFSPGFDLAHVHTPFTAGELGLRWSRKAGIPVASTCHTFHHRHADYIRWAPRSWTREVLARRLRGFHNRADAVIVPSPAALSDLRSLGVEQPAFEIRTGLDLPAQPALRGGGYMLAACRLGPEKNVPLLLEAWALAGLPLRLKIAGGGPEWRRCQTLAARLGIRDRVDFLGEVTPSGLEELFSQAEGFLFAGQQETQGLAVLEAMAWGLPVWAVEGGSAGAPIRDGVSGFLLRPQPESMAASLASVWGDPALLDSVAIEARRAAAAFSLQRMTDETLAVYHRVLGQRGARPQHELGTP